MRFIGEAEAAAYFQRLGIAPSGLVRGSRAASRFKTDHLFYRSRLNTARSVASVLAGACGDYEECVVWAADLVWGDRSADEYPPPDWVNYRLWREGHGETRGIYDAPGHVFDASERAELERLLELAIYMGWDTLVGPRPCVVLMQLSHHDQISLHARTRKPGLLADLDRLGVRIAAT
jgi:hypothetical protein